MKGAVAVIGLCGLVGCSDDVSSQPTYPNIVFPRLTVTEGGTTLFLLSFDTPPTSNLSCYLDAGNQNVAMVMPAYFHASPANYPVMLTVYGVDDMKPSGNRTTNFDGRVVDNGTYSGGRVEVVDRDSPNIVSSNWSVFMPTSSTTTFDVRLTQPPSSSTTVMILPGNGGDVQVDAIPTSLVFEPSNFNVPQTVTITSGEPGTSSISLTPSDTMLTPKNVLVTVTAKTR